MKLLMLAHDPGEAARAHCDTDVRRSLVETAQLLSTAWHGLANGTYMPLADAPADDPVTPWLVQHVLPPLTGLEQPPVTRKPEAPGESPAWWWLLCGQRIYNRLTDPHPAIEWVQALGGNYTWAWRLGLALCEEHKHRFDRRHRSEPVLWTLEAIPPPLLTTVTEWAEAPLTIPEEFKVVGSDGFYDAVTSFRRYYIHQDQPRTYTRRPPPAWMSEDQRS